MRIYLIKDSETGKIAAYFGLKAGMVASSKTDMLPLEVQRRIFKEEGVKWLPEVLPGIEISHFAVNDNYRRSAGSDENPVKGLGAFFYPEFIYPITWYKRAEWGEGIYVIDSYGNRKPGGQRSFYQAIYSAFCAAEWPVVRLPVATQRCQWPT